MTGLVGDNPGALWSEDAWTLTTPVLPPLVVTRMDCESRMQMVFSSCLGSTGALPGSADPALVVVVVGDLLVISVWGVLVLVARACTTLKPAGRAVWSCLGETGGEGAAPRGSLRGATCWMGILLPSRRENPGEEEGGGVGEEEEEEEETAWGVFVCGHALSSEGLWRTRFLGRRTTWCMTFSPVVWSRTGWTETFTGPPSRLSSPRPSGILYATWTGLFGTGDGIAGGLASVVVVVEEVVVAGRCSFGAGVRGWVCRALWG